jgi:hypothetical protein
MMRADHEVAPTGNGHVLVDNDPDLPRGNAPLRTVMVP